MISMRVANPHDAALIVDALLEYSDRHRDPHARRLADEIGDGLDELPPPASPAT